MSTLIPALAVPLLIVGLSVPMILGKVRSNSSFGFRTSKTLSSEEIGVFHIRYAATNTGEHPDTRSAPDTKAQAVELARDYVAVAMSTGIGVDVHPEDIKLDIRWKNESAYQRWHEQRFGARDSFPG